MNMDLYLARNPKTPDCVLNAIFESTDSEEVITAIACNHNASEQLLLKIYERESRMQTEKS